MRALFLIASLTLAGCATEQKPAGLRPIWWRLVERAQILTDGDWGSRYIREPYVQASKSLVWQAANEIRAFFAAPDNRKLLLEKTDFGQTPLQLAVSFGMAEIVEVLLEYPEVRAELNDDKASDLWVLASLAPYQAVRVCGDAHNNWPAMWFKGYYGATPLESPYRTVRDLLEKAGQHPRLEEARTAWLKSCRPVPPEESYGDIEYIPGARDRVADAPDTLEAILAEIQSQMTPQGLPKPRF